MMIMYSHILLDYYLKHPQMTIEFSSSHRKGNRTTVKELKVNKTP